MSEFQVRFLGTDSPTEFDSNVPIPRRAAQVCGAVTVLKRVENYVGCVTVSIKFEQNRPYRPF